MLQTLKNVPTAEAQKVLMALTDLYLPNPGNRSQSFDYNQTIYLSTLNEVKKRAFVRDGDESQKAKSRILTLLSDELTNIVLTPERKKKTKERLGVKGLLPLHDYQLVFTEIMPYFEAIGIKSSHIKNAFEKPDKYFHVENPKTPITFFSKKIDLESTEDTFVLLVICSRENAEMVVRAAWRIYLDDLNISEDYPISNLLNIFLDRYGLTIKTPSTEWSKLIWFETTTDAGQDFILIKNFDEIKIENKEYLRIATRKITSIYGVFEAFCIYAVDISKYRSDLNKHFSIIYNNNRKSKGRNFSLRTKR